jgi:hypothetical protein
MLNLVVQMQKQRWRKAVAILKEAADAFQTNACGDKTEKSRE